MLEPELYETIHLFTPNHTAPPSYTEGSSITTVVGGVVVFQRAMLVPTPHVYEPLPSSLRSLLEREPTEREGRLNDLNDCRSRNQSFNQSSPESEWLTSYLARAWKVTHPGFLIHKYGEDLVLRVVARLDDMERTGELRGIRNRGGYFCRSVQSEAGNG